MLARFKTVYGVLRSLRIYYGDRQHSRAMDAMYARFVKPGDLVFDIGSHVGDRIGSFRRLGARVVALEPQAPLIRVLRWIYGRDRDVTLVHAAAARSSGTVQLNLNPSNPTIATASRDFIDAAKGAQNWDNERWTGAVDVTGISLDELISRYGKPAFIKIDVEGFEAEALAGLSSPVKALSFEFTTIQRDVAQECLSLCAALGYTQFNAALGESQTMVHEGWQSAEFIGRWLSELPHEANSGDIYAALP
jgi:FkbM family methyltransferase